MLFEQIESSRSHASRELSRGAGKGGLQRWLLSRPLPHHMGTTVRADWAAQSVAETGCQPSDCCQAPVMGEEGCYPVTGLRPSESIHHSEVSVTQNVLHTPHL